MSMVNVYMYDVNYAQCVLIKIHALLMTIPESLINGLNAGTQEGMFSTLAYTPT